VRYKTTGWLALLLALVALPTLAEKNFYEIYLIFKNADYWKQASAKEISELAEELPGGLQYRLPGMKYTLLHPAAGYGKSSLVHFLLKEGLDPNAIDINERTPLHWAAERNPDPEVVRLLVKSGAIINARSFRGVTPLHLALAKNTSSKVARTLLSLGAYLDLKDEYGTDALGYAAEGSRDLKLIQELVKQKGFSIKRADNRGWLPIHHAASSNSYLPTHQLLVKLGADPTQNIAGSLMTPLHLAAASNPNPDVVLWYIEQGNSIDAQVGDGSQPIHLAALNPNPEVLRALVHRGANPRARNHMGNQPIHQAALEANAATVQALLDLGVDPNTKDDMGYTPLFYAALADYPEPEVARALIEAGAKVDVFNNSGFTPLLYIARFGDSSSAEEFALALLELGADPMVKNRFGMSALDMLMQNPSLREGELREALEKTIHGNP